MAGRTAAGELTGDRDPRAEGVTPFAPEDDAALRALLRASVVPGAVRVAFTREPRYAAGEGLAGGHDHTVVARRDGALVGVGRCSILPLHRNGQVQRIGYLGELRVVPGTSRAVRLLRAGYTALAHAVASEKVEAFFTSITSDNDRARRVLEHGGRMGLPAYRPMASLVTLVAPLRRAARTTTSEAGNACTPGEQEELLAFLDRQAQGVHLALSWRAARLQALAAHGVGLDDFVLIRRGGDIVGCGAIWDQRPFRQVVIDGYDRALQLARPLANVAMQLSARAPLPPPGSVLAQGALLGAVVVQPSDWAVLWPALQRQGVRRGLDWLSVARDARAPDLPTLRELLHAREYHTTLYDVALGTPARHATWDARLVRPEVGLL